MDVLVGCEFSGVVREAFTRYGHNAWSCDLEPTEIPGNHIQGDVIAAVHSRHWDMFLVFPPCTYLCNSGVRWLYKGGRKTGGMDLARWQSMRDGARFFLDCYNAPVEKVCVENSELHAYAKDLVGTPATQIIQPWQFGYPETKAAHLWLRGLPSLIPIVTKRPLDVVPRVHFESPGPNRWKNRSRTLPIIADVMARHWGCVSD